MKTGTVRFPVLGSVALTQWPSWCAPSSFESLYLAVRRPVPTMPKEETARRRGAPHVSQSGAGSSYRQILSTTLAHAEHRNSKIGTYDAFSPAKMSSSSVTGGIHPSFFATSSPNTGRSNENPRPTWTALCWSGVR